MSERFDEELLDDLTAEPEGKASRSAFDELEGADELDESDEFEESDEFDESDEFEDAAEFEAADELDELEDQDDAYESEDASDEFEEAVTDALEAVDADEFFGGLGRILKKVGKGVGSVARVVAPIASAIPIPQAQLLGRAAGLIGDVLADEGDEMDAFDELADFADDEDALDALAPVIAGVAIRSGLKRQVARLPRAHRRKLVKTVTAAARHLVRRHGPRAVKAMPGIISYARKVVARKGLPARHLPRVVAQATRAAVRSPRVLRKLARATHQLRTGRIGRRHRRGSALGLGRMRLRGPGMGTRVAQGMTQGTGVSRARLRRLGGKAHGAVCAGCGRRRTFQLRGPIHLTIESA